MSNEPGTEPPMSAQCPFDWVKSNQASAHENGPKYPHIAEVSAATVWVVYEKDISRINVTLEALITALAVRCSVPT